MFRVDGVKMCFFLKDYYNLFWNSTFITIETVRFSMTNFSSFKSVYAGVFQCNNMKKAMFVKILNGIKLNTDPIISVITEDYLL